MACSRCVDLTTRRRHRRQGLAALAVLLWLGGFELGPAVHVAFHDLWAPHGHEGDPHPHEHATPRAHGDFDGLARLHTVFATFEAARRPRRKHRETAPGLETDRGPGHGAHALAHRHLAAQTPAVAMPAVPAPRFAGLLPRPRPPIAVLSRRRGRPRARAPPIPG